jgi:hypothetical protein
MSAWQEALSSRTLRPDLLGLELEPFPYISGFGIAMRIYRLSCLEPKDLHATLGIHAWANLNLLQACHRPGVPRTRFERLCGLADTEVPKYWNVSAWSPLNLHSHWEAENLPIRHCAECAKFGYHCALFQLPSIAECPWHGNLLQEKCDACGEPFKANVAVESEVGRCSCGRDLFDNNVATIGMWGFPYEEASEMLMKYLEWAQDERSRRHFLAPKDDQLGRSAFARLASPPPEWHYGCRNSDVDIQIWEANGTPEPVTGAFWSWSLLGSERPLALCPLPSSAHQRLIDISKPRLQPPENETPAKVAIWQTREIERFIPPLDIDAGADRSPWLKLSAVDPRALEMCGRLAEATTEYFGEVTEEDLMLSPVVQKSKALDRIEGRSQLHRALEDVLVKGYEQGFDALCHVHLHQPKQLREWVAPVAEIDGTKGKLEGVRICWVPVAPLPVQPAGQVKKARNARSKKQSPSARQSRSVIGTPAKKKAR